MAAAVSEKEANYSSGKDFLFFTIFTIFLIFYYLLLDCVLHIKCYRKCHILDILSAISNVQFLKFSTNIYKFAIYLLLYYKIILYYHQLY